MAANSQPSIVQHLLALDKHMQNLATISNEEKPPQLGLKHKLREYGDINGLKRLEVVEILQVGSRAGVYVAQYTNDLGHPLPFPYMGVSKVVFKLQNAYYTEMEYNGMRLFHAMPEYVARYHTTWATRVGLVEEKVEVKDKNGVTLKPDFDTYEWKVLILDLHTPLFNMPVPETADKRTYMIMKVAWDLLGALHAMKINGIVHRDIKLDNVLWNDTEKRAVLGDLASAALVNPQQLGGLHEAVTSIQATTLSSCSLVLSHHLDPLVLKLPRNHLIDFTKALHGYSSAGYIHQDDGGALFRLIHHLIAAVEHTEGCLVAEDFSGLNHEPHIDLYLELKTYQPDEHTDAENYAWCTIVAEKLRTLIDDFLSLKGAENCVAKLKEAFPALNPTLFQLLQGLFAIGSGEIQAGDFIPQIDRELLILEASIASQAGNATHPVGQQVLPSAPSASGGNAGHNQDVMTGSSYHPHGSVPMSASEGSSSSSGSAASGMMSAHTQVAPNVWNSGGSQFGNGFGQGNNFLPPVPSSLQYPAGSHYGAAPPPGSFSSPATQGLMLPPSSPASILSVSSGTGSTSMAKPSQPRSRYETEKGLPIKGALWVGKNEPLPKYQAMMQYTEVEGRNVVTIPRIEGRKSTGGDKIFWVCVCRRAIAYEPGGAPVIQHFCNSSSYETYCRSPLVTAHGGPILVFDEDTYIKNMKVTSTGKSTNWGTIRLDELTPWFDPKK